MKSPICCIYSYRPFVCAVRWFARLLRVGALAVSVYGGACVASAATVTWNGTTNGVWGTGSNWNPGSAPTLSDDLIILGPSNVAGALTINVAASANASTMNFTDTSAVSLTNTTSAANQTLTINGTGGITTGTGAVTIGSTTANQGINIALGANQAWTVGAGGLTVNNAISGTNMGITKNGTGTLTLNGNNTFTGAVVINAGTLATGATGLLVDTANVTINSGGNYTVGAADTINSISGSGNLQLNAGLTIGTSTFSGNISGASAITTTGTLTFSGNNSNWSGGIVTSSGAAFIAGADNAFGNGTINTQNGFSGTIRSSDATDRTLANSITRSNGAPSTLIFGSAGTGNLTIQGGYSSTNGYAIGTIQVDNAWTQINGAVAGSGASYTFTKSGNGTLILSGNNTYPGATTISAGTLQIGATGLLGAGNYSQTIANSGTFIYSGTSAQTLGGIISGTGNLTQNGTGTLTLTNTNTYTGITTVNAGTLSIASITNGAVAGNLGNSTNAAGNLVLGGGSLLYTGSNASTDRNFTLTASTTSEINVSNANTTLTISGTSASTNGALTKNGSGTLVLSGNNSHSGATTIKGGTLVLSGTNTGSAITINSGGSLLSATSLGSTTVNSGGKISAGASANSVGSLTVSALTLNSGGIFTWDMSNATGAAGTGWDRIASTGLLTVNSTSGSTFTIAITSSGVPANWDYTSTNQTWDIMTYGTRSGFAANKFAFDTSAFAGTLSPDSSWALSDTGSALRLTYTYAALTPTWNGASGNWSTGFTPAITNGANATFAGAGGTTTNDIASATLSSVGTMIFSGTGSYTLQANSGSAGYNATSALAISSGITNTSTGTQTINLAMSFATNQTISATSGNIVIGGAISGAGSITKLGGNTLTLSAANSYSGGTTLAAGQLNINNAAALGNGTLTITGGSLDNTSGSSITLTSNNTQNWNGDFAFAGTSDLNLGTGAVTMNASRAITVTAGNLTVGGAIAGTGFGLTKNGSGTLRLTGNNTFTGATTVNGGTLEVGGAGLLGGGTYSGNIALNGATSTFFYNGTNSQTLSGVLSGNGAFTKNNTSTLTLSGANGGYNGTFTINSGNVSLTNGPGGAGTGSLGAAAVVLNNGATLIGNNHHALNGIASITLNNSTLTNGGYYLRNWGGALTMNNGTVNGGGDFGAGSYTLSGNNTIAGQEITNGSGVFNVTSGITTFSTSWISYSVGNPGVLTKNGTGTLILNGNNTYSAATTINAGTLEIGSAGRLGGGSYAGAITNNATLIYSGTNAQTLSGNITGTGSLSQNGTGTLTLSGANTYSGATTISAGNLSISSASALTSTSGINLGNATALLYTGSAATLNRSISVTSGTGTIQNTGSGLLTLSGGLSKNGTTLTLKGGSSGITVSGAITGSSANSDLIIDGGTVTLASANSYNGPTYIINSGTLNANAVGALPTSTLSAVTINGSSTLALGANQSVASLSGTSGSTVNLNSNTLTVNGSSTTTYSGGISGTGNIVKNGTGTEVLAAATTFTGSTTVNSGTLTAATANALQNTVKVDVNGGSLLVTANNAVNDNAAINLNGGTMGLNGTVGDAVGLLTLSANSTLDMGTGTAWISFAGLVAQLTNTTRLNIYNYTPGSDAVYFTDSTNVAGSLNYITFYSDFGVTSLGNAFLNAPELHPAIVPEPGTYVVGLLLLGGIGLMSVGRKRNAKCGLGIAE